MESKLGGRKPVKIYFLDNSSKTFLLTNTTTSLDVIKMVLQKLEVGNINIVAPYFALYESLNGTSIDNSISGDTLVLNVIKEWPENNKDAKFVFMIRLYVPEISGFTSKDIVASALGIHLDSLSLESYFQNAETTDRQTLHLQYIQCVYHVITGQYPTSVELALELGAYHFIYKFHPQNDTSYSVGFLADRIVEFIPFSHLRGSNLEEWEAKLLHKVEEVRAISSSYGPVWNPQRKYLEIIMAKLSNCFGSTFFRCSQTQFTSLPSDLYLGIHRNGVNLVERSKSRQILKQFTLRELDRWGYKPGVLFYFEVKLDGKDPTSIEFGTRDGLKMANLLTDYAHALIQEAELQKVRRMSQSVERDLEADERKMARLSLTKNSDRNSTTGTSSSSKTAHPTPDLPVPPPPPPPPPKRNSLPNGSFVIQEKSTKPHRASFTSPPPPPPKKIEQPPIEVPAPKPPSGFQNLPPSSRLSVRGAPTAPPPPPPPPKATNRPPSERITSTKSPYTPHHHQCATIIQSNYRGYALRSAWIKEDAAILIQSFYRGYAERCRVALMLEEMYRSGQLELLDDEN